jgi:predicted methyltransferase
MTKGSRRLFPRSKRARVLTLAGAVLVAGASAVLLTAERSREREADRLAELLALRPAMTVAEIGAGTGWLTVDVAARVGTAGRVYSTELSPARRDDIRQAVAEAALTNVVVVEAGERDTNLTPECCDAIFMRRVYHHLSDADAVNTSLYEALKPDGLLVIIDFDPGGLVGMITGMGIKRTQLADQLAAAGFELVRTDDWPGWDHYVAVFRRISGK